jgi:hypothetical protein
LPVEQEAGLKTPVEEHTIADDRIGEARVGACDVFNIILSCDFVAEDGQCLGFGVVNIGAEVRGYETLHSSGHGCVDDEVLALLARNAHRRDNGILAVESSS